MIDFNDTKETYRTSIDKSLAFIGADHQFFVEQKGEKILNRIARRFPPGACLRILDVGCGHGFVHPMLVGAGHDVTGLEIADQVLAFARAANPLVTYLPYDGSRLPFQDAGFDVVLAMCVVHHVPVAEWEIFLREIRRVLRPGGTVMIFEHNPLNPVVHYLFKFGFDGLDKGATMVGRRRLERLLKRAGCLETRSDYIFFTPFRGRFFRWLDRALAWLPLGAQYMTLAKR